MFKLTTFDFFQKISALAYVEKVILYGSRARGDFKERSDIDLAIECTQAVPNDWLTIVDIIDNADTLLKIDYIRLDTLNKESTLFKAIQNQGILVYSKENKS